MSQQTPEKPTVPVLPDAAAIGADVLAEMPLLARRISTAELGNIMAKTLIDTGSIQSRKPAEYEAVELDHGIVVAFQETETCWRVGYDPRQITETEARRTFLLLGQSTNTNDEDEEHPLVTAFRAERATATGQYAEFLDVLLEDFDRTGNPVGVARKILDALDLDRLHDLLITAQVCLVAADGPHAAHLPIGALGQPGGDGLRLFAVPAGESPRGTLARLRAALSTAGVTA
ncbi:hypothetical protein QCN29_26960 [Streptomyces sp. HNM0663]|uniref:Uncharacterized protein n=1 Tax=Streptomyces chengmaiensis TaxID=3040919 RepID=A0ABT6HUF7_9ACTN|nr:hypothetical protein [Streptomyces chengmaiensis]MDH2392353.1 hypothetical protein [Streptomyces chengmaiensis]